MGPETLINVDCIKIRRKKSDSDETMLDFL